MLYMQTPYIRISYSLVLSMQPGQTRRACVTPHLLVREDAGEHHGELEQGVERRVALAHGVQPHAD